MTLSIAEQLMHTTVRLECTLANGQLSTGTGFFFTFPLDGGKNIPLIVTNKHVIEGSVLGTFVLTKRASNGEPLVGQYEQVKVSNFESLWIKHPDPNVDLAVFPLGPLLEQTQRSGLNFFFIPLADGIIPTQTQLDNLNAIEDITMIGYPNGIWDIRNNMPIVRRGITATNPKYDYNGLPIFIIDCACFPGSSGSPVLIFNQGGYTDAKGNTHLGGGRLLLLGVLFAGPQHVAEGEVKTIEVPLQHVSISLAKIPNNLGFVVKAQKIVDFKAQLIGRGP
jgi:V8-like Glu-specific endopeptidase